jgi:hypothetical protein
MNRKVVRSSLLWGTASFFALACGGVVQAQSNSSGAVLGGEPADAAPVPQVTPGSEGGIQEMVVTANKREQSPSIRG